MRVAPMNSRFLDACRRRPTDVRPVWFMRQAGRYLKPYREIRARHGILEICKRPDLAAEVTLQPGGIQDVDALSISNTDELGYVGEAIVQVTRSLGGRVPLIGFVGAPFTIASYMIEGGPSKTFLRPTQIDRK